MRPATIFANTIRIASLTVGCFMMVASIPIALLAGAAPGDTVPPLSPLLVVPSVALLMASGFLYVAISGPRLAGSWFHRAIAALLLAAPLAAGVWFLLTPEAQRLHFLGFLLFAPACVLFLCAVWPLRLTSVAGTPVDFS
ncbi:MAG TPA: hypothetical protein VF774_16850 [Pseudoduganella sp.]